MRQTGPLKSRIVAVLTGFVLVMPLLTSATAAPICPGVTASPDGWVTVFGPVFNGPGDITGYALDPVTPSELYATNGIQIMRSVDGGCKWAAIFDVNSDFDGVAGRVLKIVVSPAAHDRVYALIGDVGGVAPAVMVGEASGTDWTAATGLPPVGEPVDIAVAPSDPSRAYITIRTAAVGSIYASSDGGHSWMAAAQATDLVGNVVGGAVGDLADVEVDPADPAGLWLASDRGLLHSTDGGKSLTLVDGVEIGISAVEVAPGPATAIAAYAGGGGNAFVSRDGGRTFKNIGVPGGVGSAAGGASIDDAAVSLASASAAQVYRFDPSVKSWTAIKTAGAPLNDLRADTSAGPRFYGHTDDAIQYYEGAGGGIAVPPPPPVVPSCQDGTLPTPQTPDPDDQRPPALLPDGLTIELDPGQSRTVEYDLAMDKAPVPLDVFFLVDTSGSMGGVICGLKVGLAEVSSELARLGIDVHLGAGEYKGYAPPEGTDASNIPYRLNSPLDVPGPRIISALSQMQASGGGEETQQLALAEAAQSDGEDLLPPGPSPNDVPARATGWRDDLDSIQVIIHASDERFGIHSSGPSTEDAIVALNAAGISQYGLAGSQGARADLELVAARTGAITPPGGLDCDGDGDRDLVAGSPLVCPITTAGDVNLVSPIVNILASLEDLRPVSFTIEGGDDIVADVAPAAPVEVNLLQASRTPLKVTYECTQADAGRTFDVEIGARTTAEGGAPLPLAQVDTRVTCGDLPVPAAAPPIPPPPLIYVPPQPNPPPPQQPVQPANQPQSQPNPNTQAQAQGAVAAQRQQQPQMAFVHAAHQVAEKTGMESAMVRTSHRNDPLHPMRVGFAVGVLGLIAFFGYSVASARALATARRNRFH